MERSNPKLWQAELVPHRPLSRRGQTIIVGLASGVSLAIGLVFYLAGAWPVVGFLGLDVVLLWWALRHNQAGQQSERISITPHELIVERRERGRGGTETRLIRQWVRIVLEEDADRSLVGPLYLVSKELRVEIGRFLGAVERQDLARQLRLALAAP